MGKHTLNKCITRPLGEPDPTDVDWVGVTLPRGLAMRMGRQGAAGGCHRGVWVGLGALELGQ